MQIDHDGFVQAVGDLLASWHLPHATGRIYGQLLLEPAPTSLGQLGTALGLSKGAVSMAVRELSSWGLARTSSQPGSRRLLVEATGNLETLIGASQERSRLLVQAMRGSTHLAASPVAAERLRDVSDLLDGFISAGTESLGRPHRVAG